MRLRFGSFSIAGCTPFAGLVLDDDRVVAVAALEEACRGMDLPLAGVDTLDRFVLDWDRNVGSLRALFEAGHVPERWATLDGLKRHAPIARPGQIICAGANYRRHVIELLVAQGGGAATEGQSEAERRMAAERLMDERAVSGTPYAFVKAGSALAGPDDPLILPAYARQPDWELELAVVIGRRGLRLSRDAAMDHVAGYMIANDVTARDRVYRVDDMKVLGTDWLAGKSAPGFLPTGPYLVARDDVADVADLSITLALNGEIMQDGRTSDMIFDVPRLLEHVSRYVVLSPGDVVLTGSPAGNGSHHGRFLREGDVMEGTITGLGAQRVGCVADPLGAAA